MKSYIGMQDSTTIPLAFLTLVGYYLVTIDKEVNLAVYMPIIHQSV